MSIYAQICAPDRTGRRDGNDLRLRVCLRIRPCVPDSETGAARTFRKIWPNENKLTEKKRKKPRLHREFNVNIVIAVGQKPSSSFLPSGRLSYSVFVRIDLDSGLKINVHQNSTNKLVFAGTYRRRRKSRVKIIELPR